MSKRSAANGNNLRRLVRPAFTLMLAMGQFGPNYETEGWGRLIDPLLRACIAFPLVLWALHDLRSNAPHERLAKGDTE